MSLYKFADLVVEIKNEHDFLSKLCVEYLFTGNADPELTVCVSEDEVSRERNISPWLHHSAGYLESICAYRKLCMQLPGYDALLLHSSVIDYAGRGIAFLARSGVGKTTHTMLWKQAFDDKVRIINGDKPIIRFCEGTPYAYGTPWAGKENFQCNDRVPLTDLCFVERSAENQVLQIRPEERLSAFMQQILIPSEPSMALKTLQLADRLLSACRVWIIRCNVSPDAAILARDTILGE